MSDVKYIIGARSSTLGEVQGGERMQTLEVSVVHMNLRHQRHKTVLSMYYA